MIKNKTIIFGTATIMLVIALFYWHILPDPLFSDPYSTVVFDREGELLGARIATDGQWRFPESDSIPKKYKDCLLTFEDQYFFMHPGFNPFSLSRALYQNVKQGRIVSGGSTITMQVIRLSRKDRPRTIFEKALEIILALRLEISKSKEDILNIYASHAPFGGNVVGLETAAWRYFGTDPFNLSWGETACLAVLPNAPSLMHPGRNRELLRAKRDRLLKKLFEKDIISDSDYHLAISETLPDAPRDLPEFAYHLTERFNKETPGAKIVSGIDLNLQKKVNELIYRSKSGLYAMGVRNAACMITDVESGEVLAYIGNIRNTEHPGYGGDVDIIPAKRSSGSILKPILYAFMQYRGEILPHTIIPDIPTRYGNYSPKNYKKEFDGIVRSSEALSRSLNVPAVRMLHQYGNERFLQDLKRIGFHSIDKPADYYGLSLILGGAECSLEELSSVYSSMARVLKNFNSNEGLYYRRDWKRQTLIKTSDPDFISKAGELEMGEEKGYLGAGAIWSGFEALKEVHRPSIQEGWKHFSSSRQVAWKTGTSFGFRDGWAVGTTPDYVISVWTGNANGEGRPGLTGLNAAAPILFEVLNMLPPGPWFEIPYDDLRYEYTCRKSGYKAGRFCEEKDSILISPAGSKTIICPYHQLIHLDKEKNYRVNSSCYPVSSIIHTPWFVLPPSEEWFYKQKDPAYKTLPPLSPLCDEINDLTQIQVIYPDPGSVIYVPYELGGQRGKVVFEAAHRNPESTIFWSIDEEYITETSYFHQISVVPEEGEHVLTLTDEKGNNCKLKFEVVDR